MAQPKGLTCRSRVLGYRLCGSFLPVCLFSASLQLKFRNKTPPSGLKKYIYILFSFELISCKIYQCLTSNLDIRVTKAM